MLVLSRKRDESIILGDNQIRIVVVDIRGDKVRIGIECDREISVHREEIFLAIKRENESKPHRNDSED